MRSTIRYPLSTIRYRVTLYPLPVTLHPRKTFTSIETPNELAPRANNERAIPFRPHPLERLVPHWLPGLGTGSKRAKNEEANYERTHKSCNASSDRAIPSDGCLIQKKKNGASIFFEFREASICVRNWEHSECQLSCFKLHRKYSI